MYKIVSIIIFCSCILWGCDDMNSVNQEWIDRGETIYTGAVDSLKVRPGNSRLYLVWQMNADPRITELVIKWNNKRDSLILPVVRDTEEKIGIYRDSVLIDKNLEEGETVFYLNTRDGEGHKSIPAEIVGTVYGEQYLSGQLSRWIKWSKVIENWMIIDWGDANISTRVVLHYTGSDGTSKSVTVLPEDNRTVLSDFKYGEDLYYETFYLPEAEAFEEMAKRKDIQFADLIAPYPFGTPFNGPHVISTANPYLLGAADFDKGGEGVGYHDSTTGNESGGDYRAGESVGVSPDKNIEYNADREWLNYTVEVEESALYRVVMNMATNGSAKFDFQVDGETQTEVLTAPNKGSWGDYFDHDGDIILHLLKGKHTIRFYLHAGSFNFKSFKFTYEAPWSSWSPLD